MLCIVVVTNCLCWRLVMFSLGLSVSRVGIFPIRPPVFAPALELSRADSLQHRWQPVTHK